MCALSDVSIADVFGRAPPYAHRKARFADALSNPPRV